MRLVDLKQGTEEWHNWRFDGITATDAVVACGESPYMTMRELYFIKKGRKVIEDKNKEYIFAKGHKIEKKIRKDFFDLTGIEMVPACVENIDGRCRASLDGFHEVMGALEAKYVGKQTYLGIKDGKIPEHHMIQMQWQLFVTGLAEMDYYVHNGTVGLLQKVKADSDLRARIIDSVAIFDKHLSENIIPPLTDRDTLDVSEYEEALEYLHLDSLKILHDSAKNVFGNYKKYVVSKARHNKISCYHTKLTKVTSKGMVDYSKIPELKDVDLDQYRGGDTVSWKFTNKGQCNEKS